MTEPASHRGVSAVPSKAADSVGGPSTSARVHFELALPFDADIGSESEVHRDCARWGASQASPAPGDEGMFESHAYVATLASPLQGGHDRPSVDA